MAELAKAAKDKQASQPPAQRRRANTEGEAAGVPRGETQVQAQPKRRGKRGGRSIKGNIKLEGDVAEALVKSTLRSAQKNREHDAALFDYYKVGEKHALVDVVAEEAAGYVLVVREAGKGHNMGPPSSHKGLALLKAILKADDSDKGVGEAKAVVAKLIKNIDALAPSLLCMHITQGKFENLFEEGKVRLCLGLASLEVRVAVAIILTSMGCVKYAGPAPQDGLERVLQTGLAAWPQN